MNRDIDSNSLEELKEHMEKTVKNHLDATARATKPRRRTELWLLKAGRWTIPIGFFVITTIGIVAVWAMTPTEGRLKIVDKFTGHAVNTSNLVKSIKADIGTDLGQLRAELRADLTATEISLNQSITEAENRILKTILTGRQTSNVSTNKPRP